MSARDAQRLLRLAPAATIGACGAGQALARAGARVDGRELLHVLDVGLVQAAHGLEMRTELHFGDVTQELARRLASSAGQMLIVGVADLARFAERFRGLLDGGQWPVLIVHRAAP